LIEGGLRGIGGQPDPKKSSTWRTQPVLGWRWGGRFANAAAIEVGWSFDNEPQARLLSEQRGSYIQVQIYEGHWLGAANSSFSRILWDS